MSNCMILQFCFSLILLNQWMTSLVFFHRLYLSCDSKFLLMFSKIILLNLPISLFDGLISGHDGLRRKLSLWSFSVTYLGVSTSLSIRSLSLIFFAMCFASRLIDLCNITGAFLYVLVTFSPKTFYVVIFLLSYLVMLLTFYAFYQRKQIRF